MCLNLNFMAPEIGKNPENTLEKFQNLKNSGGF